MAGSTLDPDNFVSGRRRRTLEGHDTRSLGPSDSSDSGSDLAGPGLLDDDLLGLDRGTHEDTEAGRLDADAGASVGDVGLDDNSDSAGTGERMGAGKDPAVRPGADRDTDRIVPAHEVGLGGGLDQAEEGRPEETDEAMAAGKARR